MCEPPFRRRCDQKAEAGPKSRPGEIDLFCSSHQSPAVIATRTEHCQVRTDRAQHGMSKYRDRASSAPLICCFPLYRAQISMSTFTSIDSQSVRSYPFIPHPLCLRSVAIQHFIKYFRASYRLRLRPLSLLYVEVHRLLEYPQVRSASGPPELLPAPQEGWNAHQPKWPALGRHP